MADELTWCTDDRWPETLWALSKTYADYQVYVAAITRKGRGWVRREGLREEYIDLPEGLSLDEQKRYLETLWRMSR